MKFLWLALLLSFPSFTLAQTSSCSLVLGRNGAGANQYPGGSGFGVGYPFTISVTTVVNTIKFEGGSAGDTGVVGIVNSTASPGVPTGSAIVSGAITQTGSAYTWAIATISPTSLPAGNYWVIGMWSTGDINYDTGGSGGYFVGTYTGSLPSSWGGFSGPNIWGNSPNIFADECGGGPTNTPTITPTPIPTSTPGPTPCGIWTGVQTAPTPGREESGNDGSGQIYIDGNAITISSPIYADGLRAFVGPSGPVSAIGFGISCGGGDYPVTIDCALYTWDFVDADPATLFYSVPVVSVCAHNEWIFLPGTSQLIPPATYYIGWISPYLDVNSIESGYFYIWPFNSAGQWNYKITWTGTMPTTIYPITDANAQLFSMSVGSCPFGVHEMGVLDAGR